MGQGEVEGEGQGGELGSHAKAYVPDVCQGTDTVKWLLRRSISLERMICPREIRVLEKT